MRPRPVRLDDLLAEEADDRHAVSDGARTITHGALAARARRMAAQLARCGIARGDRVAVLLPKSIPECAAIFAPSRADAVVVPINPLLAPPQVRHVLADSGARVLITDAAMLGRNRDALAGLPDLRAILLVDGDGDDGDPRVAPAEIDAPPPPCEAIGEDLAAILYTSGSTGRPKGVMLSHANLLAGTRIVRTYLGIGPDDRILSILPLSFDYGLNQLLTAVEQRASLALLTFRFGDEIVRALRDHRITVLAGVPTVWAVLTRAAPSLAKTALPDLRAITNSGGAVPTDTVARLRALLPTTRIFLMYGLTEAFRSTFLDPDEIDRRPGSIGKAIPECEVFVVTPDGRRAAPGERGTLVHRGPTVSLGYWRRPGETERVIRQNPLRPVEEGRDIVCVSGDVAYADAEGFLYFVGRRDAMIKSSGYRISPSEVEEVLMATGRFRQVAVIGLPDPALGQRVHAVGVGASEDVDVGAALSVAAGQLAAYMVPRTVELVDVLPVTANGKVDVARLVAERSADVDA
ncbi:MAG TPA: AMP-binding protein [Methylomirabilota bacterium]|nr:AMP-binding protein [Methylomirabilota bacterium]